MMENKNTLNKNSIITIKQASEILDNIFVCGTKTETKATCWATGKELDAYYYDHTLAEEAEHIQNTLKDTEYNTIDGKEKFTRDFLKWVNLGWEISELAQKRTGQYLPSGIQTFIKKQNERDEIWEKIKIILHKEQNNKQYIQPEKSADFDNTTKTTKQGKPTGSIKEKMINNAVQEENKKTEDEPNLPNVLNTEEAKTLLQKAIQNGLCDSKYKWLKTTSLLAYFAERASEYLKLGKGEYNGRPKTSWKPFETLFSREKLCGARKDYQRTGTLPYGSKDVDKLF